MTVPRGGLAALTAGAGFLHAVAYAGLKGLGWEVWVPNLGIHKTLAVLLFVAPVAIPPLVVALILARRTPSLKRLLVAMLAMMGAFTTASFVIDGLALTSPSRLPLWTRLDWPRLLLALGAALMYAVLVAAAAWWLTRTFLFSVVTQTGTLCWRCGYDRGSGAISVCPECATPVEPASPRAARLICGLDTATRRAGLILLVLLVAMAAWSGYRIVTRVLPIQRFYSAFRDTAQPGPAPGVTWSWLYVPPGQVPSGLWDGAAACVPFDDDPSRGLLIAYWPWGPANARTSVRMRVQYVQMPMPVALPAGVPPVLYPDEGSTRVYADLDARQAAEVTRAGHVPPRLAEALRRRAAEVNWNVPPGGVVGFRPVAESAVEASEYLE